MATTEALPSTREMETTDEDIRPAKGWLVVLHNDDHDTFEYVIRALCEIVQIPRPRAFRLAYEIHTTGCTMVAGPMSQPEAQSIANRIAKFGPDPFSKRPDLNVGLKTSIEIDA